MGLKEIDKDLKCLGLATDIPFLIFRHDQENPRSALTQVGPTSSRLSVTANEHNSLRPPSVLGLKYKIMFIDWNYLPSA